MSISSGTRLGPYEILVPIGAGGMGEVYSASDSKLDRQVAIKVLPKAFSRDAERVARFEREAKLLASLNHPNIAAIYGFDESNGTRFLVMEYVEGETLAARLKNGPLPIDDLLEVCRQIAEALEAAHDKGVIHRDLKPGNVMVKPDGTVKVLDFGLAKALADDPSKSTISDSPTITADYTRTGVVLGTAAYMSPEQARGKPLDKRTDIWSFGCVLYECLTGTRPFAGETTSDTIARILEREPEWGLLPPGTPEPAKRLLRRSLRKLPRERLHHIGDARIEIAEALRCPEPELPGPARGRAPRWMLICLAIGLLVGVMLGRFAADRSGSTRAERGATRLTLKLRSDVSLKFNNGLGALALSPDGRKLAFVGETAAGSRLYLRELDRAEIVPVSGAEGAESVAFSPDGDWLAFTTDREVKKLRLSGGAPDTLCEIQSPWDGYVGGLAWTSDETIVFSNWFSLFTVSTAGGSSEPMAVSAGSAQITWPQALAGDGGILFTAVYGVSERSSIGLYSPESKTTRTIVDNGFGGRYLPSGHLLFLRSGELYVAPFDPSKQEIAGAPVPILDKPLVDPWGNISLAVSDSGTLAYALGRLQNRLISITKQGEVTPLTQMRRGYEFLRLSPDGKKVGVGIEEERRVAHIYDIERDTLTPLMTDYPTDTPIWTPDGKRLIFATGDGSGPWNISWMASDFSGPIDQLTTAELFHLPGSVSPDGNTLVFVNGSSITAGSDIWSVELDGQSKAGPLVEDRGGQRDPRFSPDGKYLAYDSNLNARTEVWVRPYHGPGGAIKISNQGGYDPLWSPGGDELFYRRGRDIMVVQIKTDPAFSPGKPKLLFHGPNLGGVKHWRAWDIAPDGERFVAVEQTSAPTELRVVINWFEELKAKVPTGK